MGTKKYAVDVVTVVVDRHGNNSRNYALMLFDTEHEAKGYARDCSRDHFSECSHTTCSVRVATQDDREFA